MAEKKFTLLFIPDISGFTDFVNRTEINHSRHIISELLEIIIDSDILGIKVSEIEGDAVLCYKDSIPATSELIKQCELTFKKFHSHLKRYDTERICRCGACEKASDLSLKFIIHAGQVEKIKIKDHEKLHGSDVILAHRLMKNSIENSEYILISKAIDIAPESLDMEWIKMNPGADTYEIFGETKYIHIPLQSLHSDISPAKPISFPKLSKGEINLKTSIKAPLDLVYENFTNFEKRLQWNEEIKDIIVHGSQLNQSGSLHTCLVGNDKLDIEAIGRLENSGKVVYGERLNRFKILRDVINIYTFEKKRNETIIQTEIEFKIKSVFGKILKPMIKKKLHQQTLKGLQKLKEVSEQEEL